MARISCGASLITGPGADASHRWLAVVHAAPSFHGQDSARFFYSSSKFPIGVNPRIRDTYARDTYAFDRRLAGARPGIDLRGGRNIDTGVGLLPVQTYGG
jgi:hypothetical protein